MFCANFLSKVKEKNGRYFLKLKKKLTKKQGFWIGFARFRTHVLANCQMIT